MLLSANKIAALVQQNCQVVMGFRVIISNLNGCTIVFRSFRPALSLQQHSIVIMRFFIIWPNLYGFHILSFRSSLIPSLFEKYAIVVMILGESRSELQHFLIVP